MSADVQLSQAMKIANQQGEYNAKEAVAFPCLLLRGTANKADLRFYPGWRCTTLWILWTNLISHSCSSQSQKNLVITGDREIIRRALVTDFFSHQDLNCNHIFFLYCPKDPSIQMWRTFWNCRQTFFFLFCLNSTGIFSDWKKVLGQAMVKGKMAD